MADIDATSLAVLEGVHFGVAVENEACSAVVEDVAFSAAAGDAAHGDVAADVASAAAEGRAVPGAVVIKILAAVLHRARPHQLRQLPQHPPVHLAPPLLQQRRHIRLN